MFTRTVLFILAAHTGVLTFAQDKATLPQQVLEAEKKCTERMRATDPENTDVAKRAMATCRRERETAEDADQKIGGQHAQWAFVARYSSVDSTYKK